MRRLNLAEDSEARQLLDLQQLSYQVEASLIGYADLPPLKDTLETLRSSNEQFYGYFDRETLVGAISYESEGISVKCRECDKGGRHSQGLTPARFLDERARKGLDICRLVVHPEFFRRGIGGKLLRKIEGLEDPELMTVWTGSKNTPALELYKRFGFVALEEREVAPGVFVTYLKKLKQE